MTHVDSHYLSPEGRAIVKARADAIKSELAVRRILRATAQSIDLDLRSPELIERRAANGHDRRTVDRRGAVTVEVEGQIVIRPRSDLARFDMHPADVSAFMLDEQFRSV